MREGVGDRTELQHIDPHSYGHQRCVFLVRGLSFSAGFLYHILSLTPIISNSVGGHKAPSAGWWLSLPHLVSNSSDLQLTDFQSTPSYIVVQSPTQYLFSWLARPEYATPSVFRLACLIIIKRWCSWCNGYRRKNWTRWHEFKSLTECISHCTNTLGKGINPIILPSAMGK